MNSTASISCSSIAEFLVHAHALEHELAQGYAELAGSMEVHNNAPAAQLLQRLADSALVQAEQILQRAQGMVLPQVAPWEYLWLCVDGPQSCMDQVHYLMTPYQVLRWVMRIEGNASEFYRRLLADSSSPQVKQLATELLAGKRRHIKVLEDWLHAEAELHAASPEDLDPPHMPE